MGTYNDGNYVMVGINADNYMDYLGTHSAAAVNVTRENIAALIALGVDYISSGALTHSSPILDISMKHLRAI